MAATRAAAAVACERSVRATLRETRGAAATASFDAPPSAQPGAGGSDALWRGAGQVRAANGLRPFSYSCSFDSATGDVAGVVVRDTGAPERVARPRKVEPDLSQLSPAACESAAARALQKRWPGVTQISFDAGTRQLEQVADGPASLRGQGTAIPSVREPATHFSYDCGVDPRSGRVLSLQVKE